MSNLLGGIGSGIAQLLNGIGNSVQQTLTNVGSSLQQATANRGNPGPKPAWTSGVMINGPLPVSITLAGSAGPRPATQPQRQPQSQAPSQPPQPGAAPPPAPGSTPSEGVSAVVAAMRQALVDQQAISASQYAIMPRMAGSQAMAESAKGVRS